MILFGDEVSFAMWGSLGRTWSPRGQQPEVKTTGIRKGLKMFGVIGFFEGEFEYMESLAYCLKPKSLRQLKEAGLPIEVSKQLKPLKDQQYKTKESFIQALQKTI